MSPNLGASGSWASCALLEWICLDLLRVVSSLKEHFYLSLSSWSLIYGLCKPSMCHCIRRICPSFLKGPTSFSSLWEHVYKLDNQIFWDGQLLVSLMRTLILYFCSLAHSVVFIFGYRLLFWLFRPISALTYINHRLWISKLPLMSVSSSLQHHSVVDCRECSTPS